MKKRFTNQEITVVRNNYSDHPVYLIADRVCSTFYTQAKNFGLCEEEVFYETIRVIDDIKDLGTDYTSNLRKTFTEYQKEFRSFDSTVPSEERELVIYLIMCCVIIVLGLSHDNHHKLMGGEILNEIRKNSSKDWKDLIIQSSKKCEQIEEALRIWINSYMAIDNNEYLSDDMEKVLEPTNGKKNGTPPKEKKEKELKACCFHLGKGIHPKNIAMLHSMLTKEGVEWISEETRVEKFELLFSGIPQNLDIIWTGKIGKRMLGELFKELCNVKGITPSPGFGYIEVLENNFVYDKERNIYLSGISSGRYSKKGEDIIKECVKLFMAKISSNDIEQYKP